MMYVLKITEAKNYTSIKSVAGGVGRITPSTIEMKTRGIERVFEVCFSAVSTMET